MTMVRARVSTVMAGEFGAPEAGDSPLVVVVAHPGAGRSSLVNDLREWFGVVAVSAEAALQQVVLHGPDVVVIDETDPAPAEALLVDLVADPAFGEPPVVVLSARNDPTDLLWAGAGDVVRKPFEAPEVAARVASAHRRNLTTRRLTRLIRDTAVGIARWDHRGRLVEANQVLRDLLGFGGSGPMIGRPLAALSDESEWSHVVREIYRGNPMSVVVRATVSGGGHVWLRARFTPVEGRFVSVRAVDGTLEDITAHRERERAIQETNRDLKQALDDLEQAQTRLLQAHRLQSIGELAAGIAHEINTPIQYVADNARFLSGAFSTLLPLVRAADEVARLGSVGRPVEGAIADVVQLADAADLGFLSIEIQQAVDQALEGVGRVAEIVRGLNEFSHPGTEQPTSGDVNRVVRATAAVARSEWQPVAELVLDLDPTLPKVPILAGPLGQALLNVLINASHAIRDVVDHRGGAMAGSGSQPASRAPIVSSESPTVGAVFVRTSPNGSSTRSSPPRRSVGVVARGWQ